MKNLVLFSISTLLFLNSCQKWQHEYPEDEGRTKYTPLQRLTGKLWTLKSVTINGIDSTDSVKNKIGYFKLNLDKEEVETGLGDKIRYGYAETNIETGIPVVWDFSSVSESDISISRVNYNPPITVPVPCYVPWNELKRYEILKLTDDEFKITITYNGITKTWWFNSH